MSERLGTPDIARLLGVSRPRVWQLRKRPDFPQPAVREGGREYWYESVILRWAAGAGRELAQRAPLLYRPATGEAAHYEGARVAEGHVAMSWDSSLGRVCLLYAISFAARSAKNDLERLVAHVPHADVLVTDSPFYDALGPELTAVDADNPKRRYSPDWSDMARILGMPVPYWPVELREAEEIIRWSPGDQPAATPAAPELDVAPLLRIAAAADDETPLSRAALHLARMIQDRATRDAFQDIELLDTAHDRDAITLAAVPVRPARSGEAVPEDVRRAGWAEILSRTDTLAADCVRVARQWNSGEDFPFSTITEIQPIEGTVAVEWAATLLPAPQRTAAYSIFSRPKTARALLDPATDLPAVEDDGTIYAAVPQRLPALAPLKEVILADHMVWIRTEDGQLYIAPEQPGRGMSWGYRGGGPHALAILLNRLLDDINAPAPSYNITDRVPPEGLLALTEGAPKAGAVYTRKDLLVARATR